MHHFPAAVALCLFGIFGSGVPHSMAGPEQCSPSSPQAFSSGSIPKPAGAEGNPSVACFALSPLFISLPESPLSPVTIAISDVLDSPSISSGPSAATCTALAATTTAEASSATEQLPLPYECHLLLGCLGGLRLYLVAATQAVLLTLFP